MGEAKDIVGSPKDDYVPRPAKTTGGSTASVLAELTTVIDNLDRALQVKQQDLTNEGHSAVPENHYKLGILKGADSLIRRARAMLEDYGSDLDTALNPTQDQKATKGEEVEAHGDMAHFHSTKKGKCEGCDKDNLDLCDDCEQCQDCCFCDEAEDEDEGGN